MLQLAKGHALNHVVSCLEDLGYSWAYRVLDTRAFGLPQRRERVYLVASIDEDPRKVLFVGNETQALPGIDAHCARGFYWTEGTRGLGWAVDSVPTLKGGSALGIPSPPAVWMPSGEIVTPSIQDAERLQGFPADWTLPAESVARKGVRWKLVGNAVTVDVASWIGTRLRMLDGKTNLSGVPLSSGSKWPTAAWNVGEGRHGCELSTWPVTVQGTALADFLSLPATPLSLRATKGFLERFRVSGLVKPQGFIAALELHLERMSASADPTRSRPGLVPMSAALSGKN
jgi:DNA (cytosine-5)-methyltransferase 1